MAKEALETRMITTPSGRQFLFPDVERRMNGTVSHFTQIKNYPVQSFATADVVPLVLIEIDKALDRYNSCVVNTVHDSIVIVIHPDQTEDVMNIMTNTKRGLNTLINITFKIALNVPVIIAAKGGVNWLVARGVT